jgi:8-oxo-dGTP pyrophosphatase MutT (NUDIX family)
MTKPRWSHAGGVVVRSMEGELHYLLVEASDSRSVWVLPKGHIEKGETPEQAAVREVEEEAGVGAAIVRRAGESEFEVKGKIVRTVFFLMQYQGEIERTEKRGLVWRRYKDAVAEAHFDNTRQILRQAHALNN